MIESTSYDSTADTLKHALRVGELMSQPINELIHRSLRHDRSKTEDPELATFNEFTPKLRTSTYGSEEYKGYLEAMQVGLKHHYAHNRHHPEHFANGIDGMTLVDLIEMLADWRAATERHADGSLAKSLAIQKNRFGISDQLNAILRNTAREFRWLDNQPCGAVHTAADGAAMTCNVPIDGPEGHDGDHCDGRFEPYTWPAEDARTGVSSGEQRCSFGCRLIPGETAADHERDEHTTCAECGSEPIGRYPVAHKTSCSRMTIGPHLWPSVSAEGDERG